MKCGRKLKITRSTIEDLTSALSIGATIEIACAYAGISESSYYRWYGIGEEVLGELEDDSSIQLTETEEKCLRFYDKVEKAKSYAAIGWLQVIDEASGRDPSYALKMLKLRYPDGYKEVQHQQITGADDGPVEIGIREVVIEHQEPVED